MLAQNAGDGNLELELLSFVAQGLLVYFMSDLQLAENDITNIIMKPV